MPSFYQFGSAMLTPEQIEANKQIARGEKVEQKKEEDIINTIVDLKSSMGINVSAAEKTRLKEMRKDQLEEMRDVLIKERAEMLSPKKASKNNPKTK